MTHQNADRGEPGWPVSTDNRLEVDPLLQAASSVDAESSASAIFWGLFSFRAPSQKPEMDTRAV